MDPRENLRHMPDQEGSDLNGERLFAEGHERARALLPELDARAKIIAPNRDISVRLGKAGGGSYCDISTMAIVLDPEHLETDPAYASFLPAHEAAHAAITIHPEKLGYKKDAVMKEYRQIGFGFLENVCEDPAVNDWFCNLFPGLREDVQIVYSQMFERENIPFSTPEIVDLAQKLGQWPKFTFYAAEVIRNWHAGEYSTNLDPDVAKVLERTSQAVSIYRQSIPKERFESEKEILSFSKARAEIYRKFIWPELQEMVKQDIAQQQKAEMLKDMASGTRPPTSDRLAEQLEQSNGQFDELLDEFKEELEAALKELAPEERKELFERAKKALENFEDGLNGLFSGELNEPQTPPSHKEIEAHDAAQERAREEQARRKDPEREFLERVEALKAERDKFKSDYDKIFDEVGDLVVPLHNRLQKFFVPNRHPRWIKDFSSGSRLNLDRLMQSEADPRLLTKIWEQKTVPHKQDYHFELLIDLSGSMNGDKIQEAVKALVLTAEVLSRSGISFSIHGFQDVPFVIKPAGKEFSEADKQAIALALKEPSNEGMHNVAGSNSDGYALSEVYQETLGLPAKKKFLIVFSDGMPAPAPGYEEPELGSVIDVITREGSVELIALGIGSGTEHVEDFYPNGKGNIPIRATKEQAAAGVNDFVTEVSDLIERKILGR